MVPIRGAIAICTTRSRWQSTGSPSYSLPQSNWNWNWRMPCSRLKQKAPKAFETTVEIYVDTVLNFVNLALAILKQSIFIGISNISPCQGIV
jgi:hypothetical protein